MRCQEAAADMHHRVEQRPQHPEEDRMVVFARRHPVDVALLVCRTRDRTVEFRTSSSGDDEEGKIRGRTLGEGRGRGAAIFHLSNHAQPD
jgi:hypothetical protein